MFLTSTFGLILDSFVIYCNVNQLKFNIMKSTRFYKVHVTSNSYFTKYVFIIEAHDEKEARKLAREYVKTRISKVKSIYVSSEYIDDVYYLPY